MILACKGLDFWDVGDSLPIPLPVLSSFFCLLFFFSTENVIKVTGAPVDLYLLIKVG